LRVMSCGWHQNAQPAAQLSGRQLTAEGKEVDQRRLGDQHLERIYTGKRSQLMERKRDNGSRPCALTKHAAHCSTKDWKCCVSMCVFCNVFLTAYYEVDSLLMKATLLMKALYTASFIKALHGMQTQFNDENSVCLSVKRVICDKMEERSVQIFISYERSFSLIF